MVDYTAHALGYLVRMPQEDAEDPLTEDSRVLAEEAARFLDFMRIHMVVSSGRHAAVETGDLIFWNCAPALSNVTDRNLEDPATIVSYLKASVSKDRGLPCVLVLRQQDIAAALARLGVPSADDSQPGSLERGSFELVAPGGVISVHEEQDGKIIVRARTMVLDYKFTDFVEIVANAAAE